MNKEMTPEQALQILDQAVSKLQVTRQDHVVLQMAISILNGLVNPTKTESVSTKSTLPLK